MRIQSNRYGNKSYILGKAIFNDMRPYLIMKRQFNYCNTAYLGIDKNMTRLHAVWLCKPGHVHTRRQNSALIIYRGI